MVDAVENIKPICEVEKVGVAGKIFFRLFPGVTQAGRHQGSTELNQPLSRSQETCCETNETLLEISARLKLSWEANGWLLFDLIALK
ncbi:ribosomal protein S7 [Trifolium pratense]|uniref:Ribosomal protein S7 n=1 Tax=Trifolium pratense TaxID=57577 RepID=A0A2K3LKC4_TRIPR|nr:ribosomal protein S7 [Trifolium pratense]